MRQKKVMAKMAEGMLSQYRGLKLTNKRSYICCKVFGDLGADVIKATSNNLIIESKAFVESKLPKMLNREIGHSSNKT
jgi:hypothetical protein